MVKAGALYFSIIVAFLIAVICASLIMLAAHYRGSYLKEMRMARLNRNMDSGIAYVLAENETTSGSLEDLDLFGDQTDSVRIAKKKWGIFTLATVKSFVLADTLKRSFMMGIETTNDALAVYLSDEDRPLSVSGDTRITGDVEVPKAGMRKSYVESRPYSGDQLVYGKIQDSKRTLGGLEKKWITEIEEKLDFDPSALSALAAGDEHVSFFAAAKEFDVSRLTKISNSLSGQVTLYSDTTVRISAGAKLDNTIIYAKSIVIADGFKGNCQLFARDSIIVGNDVRLGYPSVLALVSKEKTVDQAKVSLGRNVVFEGIILSYESKRSALQTLVGLGEKTVVKGEIYATGLIKLEKKIKVEGKVSCNRFIMQTPTTLYENFLVDVTINRKARSRVYLTSAIFTGALGNRKILRWEN
ncbi:cytoskeletal protein CcmA (bactofilin family) [Flavobacterium sp. W4I14]|nr:cytoskeletal protein CcmA (bactofilin family) [Flavobacterium sp. W4I14]